MSTKTISTIVNNKEDKDEEPGADGDSSNVISLVRAPVGPGLAGDGPQEQTLFTWNMMEQIDLFD